MSEKYDEIPMAGIVVRPGNAKEYKTGGWRAERPVHIPEKCLWVKNGTCGLCWIFCPDDAIRLEEQDGEYVHIYDYDYCKGCGICAEQCPVDAIKMESE